jgi:hypothetical protein
MMCIATQILELGIIGYASKSFPILPIIIEFIMYAIIWKTILYVEKLNTDKSVLNPIVIFLHICRIYTIYGIILLALFFLELMNPQKNELMKEITRTGLINYYIFGRVGTEIGQFICIYFTSCIKPPRKTSKAREFVNNLFKKPQTALSTIKAP